MEFKSLQEWLEILGEDRRVKTVTRSINLDYEPAALAKEAVGKCCLLFENVMGATMFVVAGTACSRGSLRAPSVCP